MLARDGAHLPLRLLGRALEYLESAVRYGESAGLGLRSLLLDLQMKVALCRVVAAGLSELFTWILFDSHWNRIQVPLNKLTQVELIQ